MEGNLKLAMETVENLSSKMTTAQLKYADDLADSIVASTVSE